MVKQFLRIMSLFLIFGCTGCQSLVVKNQPIGSQLSHPDKIAITALPLPGVQSIESWQLSNADVGLKITTEHYEIFTTVDNTDVLRQIPLFWESAFENYSRMCGHIAVNEKKFPVYLFNDRQQWEDFTRKWCGDRANLYLNIQNGGYVFKNACVIYFPDQSGSFWVMGHEGWHQFSSQMFTYRLPAWIDEGLATTFEAYRWEGENVIFDVSLNRQRLLGLKTSLAWSRNRFRLSELVLSDAGQFLSDAANPGETQQTRHARLNDYYAQLYAFIRFLREDNNAVFSQALNDILNDAMMGKWLIEEQWILETSQKDIHPSRKWNKTIGKLIFQTYIMTNPSDLEERYRAFCYEIIAPL